MPRLKTLNDKGTEFVACRLTGAEKREIKALAKAEGLSLSGFFRKAIAERVARIKAREAHGRGGK